MAELRVKDLCRLGLDAAKGTPQARLRVTILVQHLAKLSAATISPAQRILGYGLERSAPWLTQPELLKMIAEALEHPKWWKAKKLGWLLKLDSATRRQLGITTIAAYDETPAASKERKRSQANERKRKARKKAGAIPRAEYLASVQKPKPWLALGISRATFFRRNQNANTSGETA